MNADGAAPQHVATNPGSSEVGRHRASARLVVGLDIEQAHEIRAHLPGDPTTADDRDDLPAADADLATEERNRNVGTVDVGPGAGAEVEDALALEKKRPLLRKEHVETRQVHLLLVHLDLREVGAPGQVGGQVLRQPILEIETDVASQVVRERRTGETIGGQAADAVWSELEILGPRRELQADKGRAQRHLHQAATLTERERYWDDVRFLVLPAHHATHVEAPDGLGGGLVTDGPERDLELESPATVEPAHLYAKYGIPVLVRREAFVGDLCVKKTSERVHFEQEPVPLVVECIDGESHALV